MLLKHYGFDRSLVMRQKRDLERNIIGSHHSYPLFDTCIYKVQFQDGLISEYASNIISENLYLRIDRDGNKFPLQNDFLYHRLTKNL